LAYSQAAPFLQFIWQFISPGSRQKERHVPPPPHVHAALLFPAEPANAGSPAGLLFDPPAPTHDQDSACSSHSSNLHTHLSSSPASGQLCSQCRRLTVPVEAANSVLAYAHNQKRLHGLGILKTRGAARERGLVVTCNTEMAQSFTGITRAVAREYTCTIWERRRSN